MSDREFVFWLWGFAYNKSEFQTFELDIIRDKIQKLLFENKDEHK